MLSLLASKEQALLLSLAKKNVSVKSSFTKASEKSRRSLGEGGPKAILLR
jgi:hypothetical protein